MTMDERIEAGLVAMMEAQASSVRRDQVRAVLAAAFPELHGDKPTHWLAPWDLTDEILNAVIENDEFVPWAEMRDAYLGKGDGG